MRIAVFHNLPAGGAKRHTYEQVKELRKRGHYLEEFAFSTADCEFMSLREYVGAVNVYHLTWTALLPVGIRGTGPYVHLMQNFVNMQRLKRASRTVAETIDSAGFDMVLVKDCMFTIAPFVLAHLSTPTVFYAHTTLQVTTTDRLQDLEPQAHGVQSLGRLATRPAMRAHDALVRRQYVRNMRSADAVLTNSQSSKRLIKQQCDVDAHVVHPGIDAETFRPEAGPRQDFVLSVGAINQAKGHRLVVEALGRLPAQMRPALVVAGAEGDEHERKLLLALASDLGVNLSIRSVHVTSEMVDLYSKARALVVGHIYEYLGNNALEAMACGTPVVAVDPCGLVENVVHGVTGVLVSERTAEAVAQGLRVLLQDPVQAEMMGRRARTYVQSYWTWPRAVDDLESQFAAVLGQEKSR